ncbi:MAG TPA: tetratricopeptide repeat protein [Candidatus Solibacter sp.]|nr:tetratricopeptide repeat protein [Candidatus Solibacter sp.]
MKIQLHRLFSLSMVMVLLLPTAPIWATCGGGGGGGMGGADQPAYQVPWKVLKASDPPVKEGLVLYWFPVSQLELEKSSLRNSRTLTLYASQCIGMEIASTTIPAAQKLAGDAQLPVAILTQADNTVVGKIENIGGKLRVEEVEKLVDNEVKKRESAVKERFESAKNKAKGGDKDGAIAEFRQVVADKCMFPGRAKDAAKELKKLGVTDVGQMFDAPNFDRALGTRLLAKLKDGLAAEDAGRYPEAERLYMEAHRMDPADATPLRYLGEVYRHHLGDWDKARATFDEILAMPSDPLSRAVALHGLGKMTIHDGEFLKGLALMERSVETFPTALAYRNLAVYWNSEGNAAKTDYYVKEALGVAPKDPYNLVFAAVFLAASGHGEEALRVANENQALLPASYNLAAIYAQMGQKDKALELLKRHFFEYERYQSVRSKEMMEARVDAVFASLKSDPAFVSLTAGADGKLDAGKMSERR